MVVQEERKNLAVEQPQLFRKHHKNKTKCANGGRFEINQLLFADDTALVADSEKLCRLVSELVEFAKEES